MIAVLLAGWSAVAGDRCEGTLCDLYYGGSPPPQAAQPAPAKPKTINSNDTLLGRFFSGGSAAPTPQPAQSQQPAPARKPLVAVQGGGLLGTMQGAPQQRCTGTLCDLYYGGPPREEPAAAPTPERAATGGDDAAGMAPQTEQPARIIEQPAERHCADAHDPWSCYRR